MASQSVEITFSGVEPGGVRKNLSHRVGLVGLLVAAVALSISSFVSSYGLWVALVGLGANCISHTRVFPLSTKDVTSNRSASEFLKIVNEVGSIVILAMALGASQLLRPETTCLVVLTYLISLLCPIIKRNALKRSVWTVCHRIGLWARLGLIGLLILSLLANTHLGTSGLATAGFSSNDVMMLYVSVGVIAICAIRAMKHSVIMSSQDPVPRYAGSVERSNAPLAVLRL